MSRERVGRCWVVALLLAAGARANVGVFLGSGHTVTLHESESIQLVSEDVTITVVPRRPPFGEALYVCRFELRNLGSAVEEVQVGFPLSAYQPRMGASFDPPDASIIERMLFVARSGEQSHAVRYVAADSEARFRHLLLWTLRFEPDQTQELFVSYVLPLSGGLSQTSWEFDPECPQILDHGLGFSLSYVTETGDSWAGAIERARFSVLTHEYEFALTHAPWALSPDEMAEAASGWVGAPHEPFVGEPRAETPLLWYRSVAPEGWRPIVDPSIGIEWTFEPFEPGPTIGVLYHVTFIPALPDDLRRFCWQLRDQGADLRVFREILLARRGVAPTIPAARKLLDNQWWYAPVLGRTEETVDPATLALVQAVDDVIAGLPAPDELSPAAQAATIRARTLVQAFALVLEWLLR